VIKEGGAGFEIERASAADVASRREVYSRQRNLMLVHTIRPAVPEQTVEGYRVFDVSIFLHPHRNFGPLNDVKSVTYFLGDRWGTGKFGSKFKVTSSNHQFALTVGMYGSFLCAAEIEFHDGHKARMERYIDAEMAPLYNVSLREARGL
jgi:hypothetical protein